MVLQEIGQVLDTPDDLVFDLFQEAAYPGQPIGRSILGPAETIVAQMPRAALVDYMAEHYGPSRMVLAAAGKIEHDQLVDLAERLFRRPAAERRRAGRARALQRRRAARGARSRAGAISRRLGGHSLVHDPDHYALQVLRDGAGRRHVVAAVPGGAREPRPVLLDLRPSARRYADTGMLGIYAGTGSKQLKQLMHVVADETAALVEPARCRGRDRPRARPAQGQPPDVAQSCSSVCDEIARQLLCSAGASRPSEIVAKLDAVDVAAVQRVGRRAGGPASPTLDGVGARAAASRPCRCNIWSARLTRSLTLRSPDRGRRAIAFHGVGPIVWPDRVERGRRMALAALEEPPPATTRSGGMPPTDLTNPDYFHKVVDCQWACPAHTPVPEYIRLIAAGRYTDAYMVNW